MPGLHLLPIYARIDRSALDGNGRAHFAVGKDGGMEDANSTLGAEVAVHRVAAVGGMGEDRQLRLEIGR